MEVKAYRSALGLVVRLLIGLLIGWIGSPLWLLFIVQISFEIYRSTRRNPSEYPALNVGAAVLGWLIGNSI